MKKIILLLTLISSFAYAIELSDDKGFIKTIQNQLQIDLLIQNGVNQELMNKIMSDNVISDQELTSALNISNPFQPEVFENSDYVKNLKLEGKFQYKDNTYEYFNSDDGETIYYQSDDGEVIGEINSEKAVPGIIWGVLACAAAVSACHTACSFACSREGLAVKSSNCFFCGSVSRCTCMRSVAGGLGGD